MADHSDGFPTPQKRLTVEDLSEGIRLLLREYASAGSACGATEGVGLDEECEAVDQRFKNADEALAAAILKSLLSDKALA